MSWGLRNRLDRVLPGFSNGTGSVMFAIDHGYFMGPTSGPENPRETNVPLLPKNMIWNTVPMSLKCTPIPSTQVIGY